MKTYPELKPMDWYHNLILERNEDGSITEEQFDAYLDRYKHIFINDKIITDYMYPFCYNHRITGYGGCYLGDTYQLLEKEFPFTRRPYIPIDEKFTKSYDDEFQDITF